MSTNEFDPGAVKILVLVLLAYFVCAFAAAMGAEYRAWKANLDALRERRELRGRYYLEQSLAKAEALHREKLPDDTQQIRSDVRAQQIAHFNHTQQNAWREYQTGYQRRMLFDGQVPIVLSLFNGAAALLTYFI